MTSKYVWQQTDDSSGYTEDNGRSAECQWQFTEGGPNGCTVYETIHWEQSWLHYSKVHQRWRQEAIHCIVLEALSCQMNRIGAQITERLSRKIDLYQSLCNRRHTLSVLRCFLPKKPEPIHFLRAMQSSNSFSLFFNFSCEGSFFFGQSSKLRHGYFRWIVSYILAELGPRVGLVSYILAEQGPRGELLT